ncbi:cell division protein FtsN [Siccibacter turicensis]|uniref:Cell division protein FtsN n=1 Tax=Siccibacter turicensis TaxID=357233 RepID=A0A2P8VF98_9ENTR|nr:cell division protein FtsN [Siccibacter turicensis]PSN06227.1 cell division protein FtsN [Siccibacter turicensis]
MAQRDYVRRGQSAPARRKKSTSRKKQRNTSSVNPAMVAIAAAVLVAFIGGLWFITHHKKEESQALPNKVTGNGLPPKPEERWRYIKELEDRQPGVRQPTEPSAGGEIKNQDQLTSEQRQLLEQMQADMRQQPTQLAEVPWNEQTPAQRQQTLQRQEQQRQVQQRQAQTVTTPPRTVQPYQQPSQTRPVSAPQTTRPVQQSEPQRTVQQQPKPAQTQQPYDDLLKTPPHNAAAQPKPAAPAPTSSVTPEKETAKRTEEKKDTRRWMIQCGSFKGADQAESVRAQLAFEGFDSRITSNNGWNRVVIGPVKGKENADDAISRLKIAGHGSCIRLASGG